MQHIDLKLSDTRKKKSQETVFLFHSNSFGMQVDSKSTLALTRGIYLQDPGPAKDLMLSSPAVQDKILSFIPLGRWGTVSLGIAYSFGQFGSAVLLLFPPSSLSILSPLLAGQQEKLKYPCLCSTAKQQLVSVYYQHYSYPKSKTQHHTSYQEEN